MKIKALDCILLKDRREVVVLEDSIPGYYLVEDGDVEKNGAPPYTIKEEDIAKITYIA